MLDVVSTAADRGVPEFIPTYSNPGAALTPRRQAFRLGCDEIFRARLRVPFRPQRLFSTRDQDDLPGLCGRLRSSRTLVAPVRPRRRVVLAEMVRAGSLRGGLRIQNLAALHVFIPA